MAGSSVSAEECPAGLRRGEVIRGQSGAPGRTANPSAAGDSGPALSAGPGQRLRRRLASNFGWTLISEGLGRGATLLANLLLARLMGTATFGIFMTAQSLAQCCSTAVDFGIGMYGVREIAKGEGRPERVIAPLFTMRLGLSLVVVVWYLAGIWLWMPERDERWIHTACAVSLVAFALHPQWILRGLQEFRLISLGTFLSAAVLLGGTALWIRGPEDGFYAASLWAGSILAGAVVLLQALRSVRGVCVGVCFDFDQWRRHARESVYFASSGGLMLVYHYLPILALRLMAGEHQTGIFAAPFRMVLSLGALSFLLPSSFYPVLAKLYVEEGDRFAATRKKLHWLACGLGMPLGLLGILLSEAVVQWTLGEGYQESVPVLRVLAWLVPCYFARNSLRISLLAGECHRLINVAFVAGVSVTVGLAVWRIPPHGAVGAAQALVGGELAILLVMWWLVRIRLATRGGDSTAAPETGGTGGAKEVLQVLSECRTERVAALREGTL